MMKISVPERLCLFGEHTDWAGHYRTMNADIVLGTAICILVARAFSLLYNDILHFSKWDAIVDKTLQNHSFIAI